MNYEILKCLVSLVIERDVFYLFIVPTPSDADLADHLTSLNREAVPTPSGGQCLFE